MPPVRFGIWTENCFKRFWLRCLRCLLRSVTDNGELPDASEGGLGRPAPGAPFPLLRLLTVLLLFIYRLFESCQNVR